jgi:hypothetical protein
LPGEICSSGTPAEIKSNKKNQKQWTEASLCCHIEQSKKDARLTPCNINTKVLRKEG